MFILNQQNMYIRDNFFLFIEIQFMGSPRFLLKYLKMLYMSTIISKHRQKMKK